MSEASATPSPEPAWIGIGDKASAAPCFRQEFVIDHPIRSATLLISGLGVHEAWINGQPICDHVLAPAQTDYEQRVFYLEHDVTPLLEIGRNAIGVVLGNGWYNQDMVWEQPVGAETPGAANAEGSRVVPGMSYGQPRLFAELHVSFGDDERLTIAADASWRWAHGPITQNNLYAGEHYDARRELGGWLQPGFDDGHWSFAQIMSPPGGELQRQTMPPIRRTQELPALTVTRVDRDRHLVDFGQNFAGWTRIHLDAEVGHEVTLKFAETVDADGHLDTASTGVFATHHEQIDRYIARGDGPATWEPRFTYHGFRYVEITGWPGELQPDEITGIVVHNDLRTVGSFECSDARLNQLHDIATWTVRSNLHGLPEDCPAREKCGWLGDANFIAEAVLWDYDSAGFWQKFLDDIETSRTWNGGIPGSVAPGKRCSRSPARPDWAAAFVLLPWYVYLHTADVAVLERHWDGTRHLMSHFESIAENWILTDGYGDYFDTGGDAIVQHTPPALTSTLWFFKCARVMQSVARRLGHAEDAEMFADWSKQIESALLARFFDQEQSSFGSQTGNALAIGFGVLLQYTQQMADAIAADVRGRGTHLTVGGMGMRYLFEVLTRHGHGELALAIMHQDEYPGFGDLIARGATTLWESWGEAEHDIRNGPRSLNHPFKAGYVNFIYNTLAGIRIDENAPGFAHMFLEPHPIPGIEHVSCHHECRFGRIESSWQRRRDEFVWQVTVPAGTTATATLPLSGRTASLAPGRHHLTDSISH